MKDNRFKVTNGKSTIKDGRSIAQIDFEFFHPPKDLPFIPFQKGRLFLDPKNYWCIVGSELYIEAPRSPSMFEVRSTKIREMNGYPVPTKTQWITYDSPNGRALAKTVYTFDLTPAGPLPDDEEFTLSAFGLPEPFEAHTRPISWYIWVAGAGILCVVGGFLFMWRRKKYRA